MPPDNRDDAGQFKPGQSGNPGGRRSRMDPAVKEMLFDGTRLGAQRLIEALSATMIVHYKGEEVGEYVDHDKRLRAIQMLFDRLYGHPAQTVTGEDGAPLTVDLGAQLIEAIKKLGSGEK